MKILHTADWHLGHRLHEQSQAEEQDAFLAWLLKCIDANEIDILLVSGDIFDTGVPSTQAQKMYYDFLIELKSTACKHVVITGGNHDAPGTLNAPQALLNALSIHVVGKAPEDIAQEIFHFELKNEAVTIAAVPYLRDQDIRRAVAGETFDELGERYKAALVNHYQEVADYCEKQSKPGPLIAMGHLFAVGGQTSDSENIIYVGNLGDIGAEDFPKSFDYVALGHLHRPQIIGGNPKIRYAGSPNVLSFSEIGYDKKVIILTVENNAIKAIDDILIPIFRKVLRISGTVEECIDAMNKISTEKNELKPWIEVVLSSDAILTGGNAQINQASEGLALEVLKITRKEQKKLVGLEELIGTTTHVKELSPDAVFKLKCQESNFDLKENPAILDAFYEILALAKGEGDT